MVLQIVNAVTLAFFIVSVPLIIKANAEWNPNEKHCDEDCERCPFPPCKSGKRKKLKNYIGVKIIKAEPQEKDGEHGYRVKYPDGYESWSPKDAFEKAYRELDCKDFINEEE